MEEAASLPLRQVTRKVPSGRSRGNLVLITDLRRATARPIGYWYGRRWEIETDFRHLKTTLNLEFFKSKSVEGVRRELVFRQIAYNLVRRMMLESGRRQGGSCHRIIFGESVETVLLADPSTLIRLTVLPKRKRTARPRKTKYRGKNHGTMNNRSEKQRRVA